MKFQNTLHRLTFMFFFAPLLLLYSNCQEGSSSSQARNSDTNGNSNQNNTLAILQSTNSELFFEETVKPTMETRCKRCHDQPRFGGNAPLTIYDFGFMGSLLAQGESATDNSLLRILQNIDTHEGGNSCPQGIISTPCREFVQWRLVTLPDSEIGGGFGAISYLSLTGEFSGWAMDPQNPESILEVEVYFDGPKEQGEFGGRLTANLQGIGGDAAGHYFRSTIPSAFLDGESHRIFAYTTVPGEQSLLSGMPKEFVGYQPKAESFFERQVTPQVNCTGCHVWTYETAFPSLINPTPANGGSRTNNRFIDYIQGKNGHPGGNICSGGIDSGLCAAVQEWWSSEFGEN